MTRWLWLTVFLLACELPGGASDGGPADGATDGASDGSADGAQDALTDGVIDAGDGAADAAPDMAPVNPDLVIYPGCRNDSFFVEYPIFEDGVDPDLGGHLTDELTSRLQGPEPPGWFCESGVPCDVEAATLTVQVGRVLPERAAPDARVGGHLRFYRVAFFDEEGARVPVRLGALCRFVTELRDMAPPEVRVGRECDLQAMAVEATVADVTNPMRHWHLGRLGLAPRMDGMGQVTGYSPLVLDAFPAEPVHVALLDTGVEAAVTEHLEIETVPVDTPFIAGGAPLHPHGTGMALLVAQLLPDAQLHDLRILDTQGVGTMADLARALDVALFDLPRPLVVNLSLGWPAALSSRRTLRDTQGCETYEDGVGNAVRYVLEAARQTREAHPYLVVTAGGNRPVAPDRDPFDALPVNPADEPECADQRPVPGEPWLFMPAEWSRRPTCRDPAQEPGASLVLAAGSIDVNDRSASLGIPGAEPPLVAPGEHVYAWVRESAVAPLPGDLPAPIPPPACDEMGLVEGVTLPAVFSGSSVGAALTSGVAAHLLRHLAASEPELSPETVARTLYWTGTRICNPAGGSRDGVDGLAVRRPDPGRIAALLTCESGSDVIRCFEQLGPGPISLSDRGACGPALDLCGIIDEGCERPPDRPVRWPAGFDTQYMGCATDNGAVADPVACGALGCDTGDAVSRYDLGSAGPQPGEPTCPDCAASPDFLGEVAQSLKLVLDINPKLASGTTIAGAWLVVDGPQGNTSLDLETVTTLAGWKPGARIIISDIPIKNGLPEQRGDWKDSKVTLVTTVVRPDGGQSADYSGLRVNL